LTALTTLGLAAPPEDADACEEAAAGAVLGVLGLAGVATGAATAAEDEATEEEEEEEEDCLAILIEFICELVGLLFYTPLRGVCLSYFGT
jgi:hypothetical protein